MASGKNERREFPRFPVELRIEFKHLGRPNESFGDLARNLSAGGCFVETSVGLELGTELALEIAPGPSARPIMLRAEVIRVEEEPAQTGSRTTTRTRGMALKFLSSEAGELERLRSLVDQMKGQEVQHAANHDKKR